MNLSIILVAILGFLLGFIFQNPLNKLLYELFTSISFKILLSNIILRIYSIFLGKYVNASLNDEKLPNKDEVYEKIKDEISIEFNKLKQ